MPDRKPYWVLSKVDQGNRFVLLVGFTIFSLAFIVTALQHNYMAKISRYRDVEIDEHMLVKFSEIENQKNTDISAPVTSLPNVFSNHSNDSKWCQKKILKGLNYTIIYNAMPKTGSRTLGTLSRQLFRKRFKSETRFKTIAITPNGSALRLNSTKLVEYYRQTNQNSAFIRGHNIFIPPLDRTFVCINTIREPILWMTSLYYFKENGDSLGTKQSNGYIPTGLTFDECFSRNLSQCKPQIEKYLRYFCGDDPICNTSQALDRSKANIDKFLFVGIFEELKDSIRTLELLMPDVFKGLATDYKNKFRALKQDYKTVSKKKLLKKTEEALKRDPNVRVMYEFYEYAKDRFHRLKKCLLQDKKVIAVMI